MSTQYNTIQAPYDYIRKKTIAYIEHENIQTAIFPFIQNARVLELACGSGFYTYSFLKWGAKSVVAIDISPAMIEEARRVAPSNMKGTVEFHLADCSKPTSYPGGSFDVVFGAWLLNYAPDRAGLVEMFRNIALNLKEDGHFVSITVPPTENPVDHMQLELEVRPPPVGSGGLWYEKLSDVEEGIYFHVHGDTPLGNVDFDCYHLKKSVYEEAAREAGLKGDLNWGLTTVPDNYLRDERPGGASIEELNTYQMVTNYGVLVVMDQELSAKIGSELQIEREQRDSEKLPPNISDYLDSSSFELQDTPGHEEVVLTRQFGDESIRISFSIADLNALDQDPDEYNDDKALYDEEPEDIPGSAQSGGGNTKGAINQGRTKGGNINVAPEDSIAPADREELMDDESASGDDSSAEPSFPARVNVTIEKKGKGVMQIETTAQDGEIVIENVYYFKDAALADAKTADSDYKRRNVYSGPPFSNLDENLQVLLERYLDERGVNTALALWVPEYIDFKEQREYLAWLSNVQSFVDA